MSPRVHENRFREPWTNALAEQLRAELGVLGIYRQELATRSGVPDVTLRGYMKAATPVPFPALAALCEVFGLRVSEFTARAEERVRPSDGPDI